MGLAQMAHPLRTEHLSARLFDWEKMFLTQCVKTGKIKVIQYVVDDRVASADVVARSTRVIGGYR